MIGYERGVDSWEKSLLIYTRITKTQTSYPVHFQEEGRCNERFVVLSGKYLGLKGWNRAAAAIASRGFFLAKSAYFGYIGHRFWFLGQCCAGSLHGTVFFREKSFCGFV